MRQGTILAAAIALTLAFSAAPPRLSHNAVSAEGLSAEAKRKAYEDEMLARARAEAEERRREMEKARAEEERIAAEELAREEEARRLSERLKVAGEARKAAEAARRKQQADFAAAQREAEAERIAEARRRAEAERIAEAQRRVEEERIAEARRRAEAERIAEAQRRAEEEARTAEAQRRADEAAQIAEAQRRTEDAARIAEAQRRIEEAQRKADEAEVAAKRRADSEALAAVPAPPAGATDRQFTILMVLEAGHRGIRRHNPTGDPILCASGGCFVSAGSESPAEFLPGRKALGLGATLGRRAGACRDQLGCVFRTVELGALPVHVQPVDMRLVRHDRRAAQEIVRDSHCRFDHGTIDCARPYVGPDYIMWVVPEWMAQHVGAAGLEAAVSRGLITRGGAAVAGGPMPWTR